MSVLADLREQLPGETFLYVADSAYAPYGPRSSAAILQRCRHIMSFFLARKAKAVVLACNTATAAAVNVLRQEAAVPIIGMEPALKPAAAITRSGVVAVLATEGTLNSDRFLSLKDRYARQVEAITVACHGWVDSIEQGEAPEARRPLLEKYLQPVLARGADTLILGCTHYPLIRAEIAAVVAELKDEPVEILDTGKAVARELARRLGAGVPVRPASSGGVAYFTSGDADWQSGLFSRLCGVPVQVDSLPTQEEPVQG